MGTIQPIMNAAGEVIVVKCKSCRYFGQHWSKPGLQGYCIKLTKNVDGSKPMCKEFDTWRTSESRYSGK